MEFKIRNEKVKEIVFTNEASGNEKDIFDNLGHRIEKYMIEEKPFLYEDVSVDSFCKALNTNRTYIFKATQHYFNKSFNELLFQYRINAARELLTDPSEDHISIDGIGKMAGFKSSSVFFKRFKSMTGLTPDYYRKHRQ